MEESKDFAENQDFSEDSEEFYSPPLEFEDENREVARAGGQLDEESAKPEDNEKASQVTRPSTSETLEEPEDNEENNGNPAQVRTKLDEKIVIPESPKHEDIPESPKHEDNKKSPSQVRTKLDEKIVIRDQPQKHEDNKKLPSQVTRPSTSENVEDEENNGDPAQVRTKLDEKIVIPEPSKHEDNKKPPSQVTRPSTSETVEEPEDNEENNGNTAQVRTKLDEKIAIREPPRHEDNKKPPSQVTRSSTPEIVNEPEDNEENNGDPPQVRTKLDEKIVIPESPKHEDIPQSPKHKDIPQSPKHEDNKKSPSQTTAHKSKSTYVKLCLLISVISSVTTGYLSALPGQLLGLDGVVRMVSRELFRKKAHAEVDLFCTFLDARILAVLGSSIVMQFCGFLGVNWMARRVGRKITFALCLVISLVAILVVFWLPNIAVFVTAFEVLNIGIGGLSRANSILQSELLPNAWTTTYDIATNFGAALAILVIFVCSERETLALKVAYGVSGIMIVFLLFLTVLFLPESPQYWIEKGKTEKARNILRTLENEEEAEARLEKAEVTVQRLRTTSVFVVLRPLSRVGLLTAIMSTMVAFFSVVGVIQYYGPIIFQSITSAPNAQYIGPALISGIQIASRTISVITARRYGRRNLLLGAVFLKCVSEAYLAATFSMTADRFSYFIHPWRILIPGLANVAADGCLTASGIWLESPFPDESKEVGGAIAKGLDVLQNAITTSFSVLAFCKLNRNIFFPFMLLDVVALVYILLLLPETTKVDMIESLGSHWFWKSYVKETDQYGFV